MLSIPTTLSTALSPTSPTILGLTITMLSYDALTLLSPLYHLAYGLCRGFVHSSKLGAPLSGSEMPTVGLRIKRKLLKEHELHGPEMTRTHKVARNPMKSAEIIEIHENSKAVVDQSDVTLAGPTSPVDKNISLHSPHY